MPTNPDEITKLVNALAPGASGTCHDLPPQFTEGACRRYESTIASILDSWPGPITLDPAPFSPETIRSRLRDAMRSFVKYRWPCSFDLDKLNSLLPTIIVARSENKLVVGDRTTVKTPRIDKSKAPLHFARESDGLNEPAPEVLRAVALLLATRHLAGPVKISSATSPTWLSDEYDIEVVVEGDGRYILI
jgi:hypothetical protein